jgi:hypothetical protein
MGNWRQYRPIEKGEFFVVFADTSYGAGDYCAVQFLSKIKIDVPLVYHSKTIATNMTNEIYPILERIHDITGIKPVVAYERQNGGAFEMDRLASLNRAGKFNIFTMVNKGSIDNAEGTRLGWDTNTATRPTMLQDLKDAIDHNALTLYDKPTITELYSFILAQTSSTIKAQAEKGAHDDLVMSLAGAWQLYQVTPTPNPAIDTEWEVQQADNFNYLRNRGY